MNTTKPLLDGESDDGHDYGDEHRLKEGNPLPLLVARTLTEVHCKVGAEDQQRRGEAHKTQCSFGLSQPPRTRSEQYSGNDGPDPAGGGRMGHKRPHEAQ